MTALYIFRTDIKSKKKVKEIRTTFDKHADVVTWNVDLDDIDNVLRIETKEHVREQDLMHLVRQNGYYIEPLPD